ncbi:pentapeptide repeat-containing protein [Chondromyces crocatus]|uniref:Pentapeptide repeat-containing protein n=1 Tax=Chondromyces crocatus TaxID=52 RepID=A0A0K1EIG3_CHOCO|nr:pentapeptide repeat-containing protein [Chondromyces crocatus]AKT40651.1 uncharacterized protein CMC5_048070 [Chondromyces crocatus]
MNRSELRKRRASGEHDLRGVDLSGADLRGFDLRGADLRGADLTEADLHSTDLRGAVLAQSSFDGARLTGARMDASTCERSGFSPDQVEALRRRGVEFIPLETLARPEPDRALDS